MYDLHVHILPGIDDGPRTIKESLAIARIAFYSGTKVLVATPHKKDVNELHSIDKIVSLTKTLNNLLNQKNIKIKLLLGMENHMSLDLVDDYLNGFALTINKSRYMLVEMPFFGSDNYVYSVISDLINLGVNPILAHPERIEMFQKDIKTLNEFLKMGLLTQITAGSINGYFGDIAKDLSLYMLKNNLVNIISSDSHSAVGNRSPVLTDCEKFVSKIIGFDKFNELVTYNPLKVIQNKEIISS